MPTPSQRQRRRREAGSEGSPRQNPAPRNTNRIRGEADWVSRQSTAKPVTTKRPFRRCGGGRGKVIVLIRGGLFGSPEMPGHHVRRVEVDHGGGNASVRRGEVSRSHSTGGDKQEPGRAERMSAKATFVLVGEAVTAANPRRGLEAKGVR